MVCVDSDPTWVPEFGPPPTVLVVAFLFECLVLKRSRPHQTLPVTWVVTGFLAMKSIADTFGIGCHANHFEQALRIQALEALYLIMWTTIFSGTEYVVIEIWSLRKRWKDATPKSAASGALPIIEGL